MWDGTGLIDGLYSPLRECTTIRLELWVERVFAVYPNCTNKHSYEDLYCKEFLNICLFFLAVLKTQLSLVAIIAPYYCRIIQWVQIFHTNAWFLWHNSTILRKKNCLRKFSANIFLGVSYLAHNSVLLYNLDNHYWCQKGNTVTIGTSGYWNNN